MKTPAFLLSTLALAAHLMAVETLPAIDPRSSTSKEIQTELVAILESDQSERMQVDDMMKKYGMNSPEWQTFINAMRAKDAGNAHRVCAILDQYGWLGPDEVGEKANRALFLVIQHSDLAIQQKYLPMLRTAVKDRKANPAQLALLEDRVALAEGRLQVYGSQLRTEQDGHTYVRPMIDPEHVDERRASVGLPPMAEYLKHWNLTWDAKAFAAAQAKAEAEKK